MTQRLNLTNYARFNLSSILHAADLTLTPPSYTGFPTTGQFPLVAQDNLEIIYVTDASIHPWPIIRAQEGTTAVDHAIGTLVRLDLTAGELMTLVDATDKVLTDDAGGVLVDDHGNLLLTY